MYNFNMLRMPELYEQYLNKELIQPPIINPKPKSLSPNNNVSHSPISKTNPSPYNIKTTNSHIKPKKNNSPMPLKEIIKLNSFLTKHIINQSTLFQCKTNINTLSAINHTTKCNKYNKTTNEFLMNTNNENSKDKYEKSNKHLKTAIIPLYNVLDRLWGKYICERNRLLKIKYMMDRNIKLGYRNSVNVDMSLLYIKTKPKTPIKSRNSNAQLSNNNDSSLNDLRNTYTSNNKQFQIEQLKKMKKSLINIEHKYTQRINTKTPSPYKHSINNSDI